MNSEPFCKCAIVEETSLFECRSLDSRTSQVSSIFDTFDTERLDLNKFLDDMIMVHEFIDSSFHDTEKRFQQLHSQHSQHKQLLKSSIDRSDLILARLRVMRAELEPHLLLLRPVATTISETQALHTKRDPVYSSEYIENYIKGKEPSTVCSSPHFLVVAIIAMLVYLVYIRDLK